MASTAPNMTPTTQESGTLGCPQDGNGCFTPSQSLHSSIHFKSANGRSCPPVSEHGITTSEPALPLPASVTAQGGTRLSQDNPTLLSIDQNSAVQPAIGLYNYTGFQFGESPHEFKDWPQAAKIHNAILRAYDQGFKAALGLESATRDANQALGSLVRGTYIHGPTNTGIPPSEVSGTTSTLPSPSGFMSRRDQRCLEDGVAMLATQSQATGLENTLQGIGTSSVCCRDDPATDSGSTTHNSPTMESGSAARHDRAANVDCAIGGGSGFDEGSTINYNYDIDEISSINNDDSDIDEISSINNDDSVIDESSSINDYDSDIDESSSINDDGSDIDDSFVINKDPFLGDNHTNDNSPAIYQSSDTAHGLAVCNGTSFRTRAPIPYTPKSGLGSGALESKNTPGQAFSGQQRRTMNDFGYSTFSPDAVDSEKPHKADPVYTDVRSDTEPDVQVKCEEGNSLKRSWDEEEFKPRKMSKLHASTTFEKGMSVMARIKNVLPPDMSIKYPDPSLIFRHCHGKKHSSFCRLTTFKLELSDGLKVNLFLNEQSSCFEGPIPGYEPLRLQVCKNDLICGSTWFYKAMGRVI